MPVCDLKNVYEDALEEGVMVVMDDLFWVHKHWRTVNMGDLQLRDVEDLLTRDEIRVNAPGFDYVVADPSRTQSSEWVAHWNMPARAAA
jgi:hypothetical protein